MSGFATTLRTARVAEASDGRIFLGGLVAAVGELGLTYHDLRTHIHTQTQALNADFFFFAYSITVMLAICSRSADAGLRSLAWLDGAQALIATILAYLQLFSVLPSHARPEAISATNLMHFLEAARDAMVVVNLTAATDTYLLQSQSRDRRAAYRRGRLIRR
jgi:hypothetical protein